jgi:hypothetical protein
MRKNKLTVMDNITTVQQQQARYERLLAFQEAYEALKPHDIDIEEDNKIGEALIEALTDCQQIAGRALLSHNKSK